MLFVHPFRVKYTDSPTDHFTLFALITVPALILTFRAHTRTEYQSNDEFTTLFRNLIQFSTTAGHVQLTLMQRGISLTARLAQALKWEPAVMQDKLATIAIEARVC